MSTDTTDTDISKHLGSAFDQWLESDSGDVDLEMIKYAKPDLLRRVFLLGASVGTQIQAAYDKRVVETLERRIQKLERGRG